MVDLSKFTSNKKILSKIVAYSLNYFLVTKKLEFALIKIPCASLFFFFFLKILGIFNTHTRRGNKI